MTLVPPVIVALGALVLVACALAVLRLPGPFERLHAVTPATSLGGILVCLGLALHDRTTHDVGKLIVIAVLLFVTAPAASIAAARAARARHEDTP